MPHDPSAVATDALERKNCGARVEDRGSNMINEYFALLPPGAPDRAFPDDACSPAQRAESFFISQIALNIAADLRLPKFWACFRPMEQWAVMAVPEATVDEERSVMAWQHQI